MKARWLGYEKEQIWNYKENISFIQNPLNIARDLILSSPFASSTIVKGMEKDHWDQVLEFEELDARMIAVSEWLELITQLNQLLENKFSIWI
jgi:hypothetical protein